MGFKIMLQTISNTQTCNFVRLGLSLPNMIYVVKSRRMTGGRTGTNGRPERCTQGFGGET